MYNYYIFWTTQFTRCIARESCTYFNMMLLLFFVRNVIWFFFFLLSEAQWQVIYYYRIHMLCIFTSSNNIIFLNLQVGIYIKKKIKPTTNKSSQLKQGTFQPQHSTAGDFPRYVYYFFFRHFASVMRPSRSSGKSFLKAAFSRFNFYCSTQGCSIFC